MREAHGVSDDQGRPSPVEVLARLAAAVHGALPLEEKLTWVAEALLSLTDASFGAYVALRPDGGGVTGVAGVAAYEVDVFARPAVVRLISELPQADHLPEDELRRDRLWRTFLERAGVTANAACLCVPVRAHDGAVYGALIAGHPDPEHFYGEDEAAASALACHVGVALDNQATMARLTELQQVQRQVVHQLQEAVRPPVPTVEAVELGLYFLPADPSAPTGGDLHDWFVLPGGDLYLAVVDVMGKGVAATKDAVAIIHALRMLVLDGCPMENLVSRADVLLTSHNPDLVATVIIARYRPSDGRLWLAGGGQPPPVVVSGQGEAQLVPAPGVALGWPGAGSGEVVELSLDRNGIVVLYTDGLIESTKDVLVGLDNLTRAAAQIAQYPSAHLARALVERSLSGAMRRDDSLALALRRRTPRLAESGVPLGAFEYRFSPSPATVPLGRHLLADWLDHLSVDPGERSDLLLVASELCANAVHHASGLPGALCLRAWAEGDAIVIEVEDDGEGFELRHHYDDELPDPDAERGRGLYVVEALTDVISVRRENGSTIVRAVRRAVLPG